LFFPTNPGYGLPKSTLLSPGGAREHGGAAEQSFNVRDRLGRCLIRQVVSASKVARRRDVASRFVLLGVLLHLGEFWGVVKAAEGGCARSGRMAFLSEKNEEEKKEKGKKAIVHEAAVLIVKRK
jgi:hypothetical protein